MFLSPLTLCNRTPCGFCFVEYYTHAEALACMRYVSGTKLDERIIRCDLDMGYKEGRQFGRGKSGGQVRDEHRQDYDPGRGGWGAQAQKLEIERRREVEERYADAQDGPGAVAGGGGEWKEVEGAPEEQKKRARSPDDEGDNTRTVGTFYLFRDSVSSFNRVIELGLRMKWKLSVCNCTNSCIFNLCWIQHSPLYPVVSVNYNILCQTTKSESSKENSCVDLIFSLVIPVFEM